MIFVKIAATLGWSSLTVKDNYQGLEKLKIKNK